MRADEAFQRTRKSLPAQTGLTFRRAQQVLCSQKDKVIVKDYNHLREGNTTNTKAESQFEVDYVLDDSFLSRSNRQRKEESQRWMFKDLGKPCVENALNGYNSTIMAYGQMGSGKTYTMMGDGAQDCARVNASCSRGSGAWCLFLHSG